MFVFLFIYIFHLGTLNYDLPLFILNPHGGAWYDLGKQLLLPLPHGLRAWLVARISNLMELLPNRLFVVAISESLDLTFNLFNFLLTIFNSFLLCVPSYFF